MDNSFFTPNVDRIFTAVGLSKADAPEMHEECGIILANTMAHLSATMGLSFKRMDAFKEQEDSLIEDLKKMKNEKALR